MIRSFPCRYGSLAPLLLALSSLLLLSYHCHAQAPVTLAPLPQLQFFDQSGRPLSFGCVFTYATNSTNPLATYTDYTGSTQNQNPVILSAGGSANIWLQAGVAYAFKVKASGGLNCVNGTTQYTVNGIGGGVSILTTVVTFSASPTFAIGAQNQLFQITLTGNATANPLSGVGIVSPGIVTFQIIQDGAGGHTFSWPANSVGGAAVCAAASCVTQQTFIWNGTNATALGPATYSVGPAYAVTSLFDFALSASAPVCTDGAKQLTSSCNPILGVIYNGQTVNPGGSGNVNAGAAAHSVALNEGAGAAIAGLTLALNQIPVGQTAADPAASTLPTCLANAFFSFTGTPPIACLTVEAVQASSMTLLASPVSVSTTTPTPVLTKTVTMPAAGCPCRVLLSYGIYFASSSSGIATSWARRLNQPICNVPDSQ